MSSFFRGLVLGLLGFMSWILVSLVVGLQRAGQGEAQPFWALMWFVSLAVMTLGPLLYWLVLPLLSLLRRLLFGRPQPQG